MKPFLTAEWRNLVMVNYEADAEVLNPYLPLHTELDAFNGKVYVSLVAFHFLNTKVKGIAVPFHRDFEEVNLRFYVKYKEGREWKRGVVFISELVPKRMIAFVARLLYGEKYVYAPIYSSVKETDIRSLQFSWGKDAEYSLFVDTEKKVVPLEEGSEAQFILEHYWGYTSLRNGATSQYRVAHPSWNIYPVLDCKVNVNFETLYGKTFGFLNHLQPTSVVVAEGSPVAVYDGKTMS
jgi:uncharacterized protein YqjF (DUF2071 family)